MEPNLTTSNPLHAKWKRLKNFAVGWRSLLSSSEPLYLAAAQIQLLTNSKLWAAIRSCLDFLAAFLTLRVHAVTNSLIEGWTNKRLRAGVLIVLLSAPAWNLHFLFDLDGRSETWYWQNFAFYFNNIKGYMVLFFVAIGGFIAAPQKWKFRWWSLPLAFFAITEIYDRYFYDDYKDFQQVMPDWRMWGIMALCIPALFFSMNYLLYRKYHLKDGTAGRIVGIWRAPNIPRDLRCDRMEQLAQEAEQFNARV